MDDNQVQPDSRYGQLSNELNEELNQNVGLLSAKGFGRSTESQEQQVSINNNYQTRLGTLYNIISTEEALKQDPNNKGLSDKLATLKDTFSQQEYATSQRIGQLSAAGDQFNQEEKKKIIGVGVPRGTMVRHSAPILSGTVKQNNVQGTPVQPKAPFIPAKSFSVSPKDKSFSKSLVPYRKIFHI